MHRGTLLRSRGNANDYRQYILTPLRLWLNGVLAWFSSSSLQAFSCINIVPYNVHLQTINPLTPNDL
jgi:hypothetical protein